MKFDELMQDEGLTCWGELSNRLKNLLGEGRVHRLKVLWAKASYTYLSVGIATSEVRRQDRVELRPPPGVAIPALR